MYLTVQLWKMNILKQVHDTKVVGMVSWFKKIYIFENEGNELQYLNNITMKKNLMIANLTNFILYNFTRYNFKCNNIKVLKICIYTLVIYIIYLYIVYITVCSCFV